MEILTRSESRCQKFRQSSIHAQSNGLDFAPVTFVSQAPVKLNLPRKENYEEIFALNQTNILISGLRPRRKNLNFPNTSPIVHGSVLPILDLSNSSNNNEKTSNASINTNNFSSSNNINSKIDSNTLNNGAFNENIKSKVVLETIQEIENGPKEILEENNLTTKLKLSEELTCTMRLSDLSFEKYEFKGLLQILGSYVTPITLLPLSEISNLDLSSPLKVKSIQNTSVPIIYHLKMSATRGSVESVEVNPKFVKTNTSFIRGNENGYSFKTSIPLLRDDINKSSKTGGNIEEENSSNYISQLRYSVSPSFKVKLLIAQSRVTVMMNKGIPKLRVQVQVRINDSFKSRIEDFQVMASIKKLLFCDIENPICQNNSNNLNNQNSEKSKQTFKLTSNQSLLIKDSIFIPKGSVSVKDSVLMWTTNNNNNNNNFGSAESGSVIDFDSLVDLQLINISNNNNLSDPFSSDPFSSTPSTTNNTNANNNNNLVSLEVLQTISNTFPVVPLVIRGKYKYSLVSKTRFSISKIEFDGNTVSEEKTENENAIHNTQEILSAKFEYRFIESD